MAFLSNTVGNIDNFNQANGALAAGWSGPIWNGDTKPTVVSNAAKAQASGFSQAYRTGLAIGDSECAIFVSGTPGNYYQAYSRIQTASLPSTNPSNYQFGPDSGTLALYRISGGVGTQLGSSSSITPATGDGYGIECIGSAIKGYKYTSGTGWVLKASGTDTTYATGSIGFEISNGSSIDDFSGGAPVTGGGGSTFNRSARLRRLRGGLQN